VVRGGGAYEEEREGERGESACEEERGVVRAAARVSRSAKERGERASVRRGAVW
jgi:hypothetical protein